MNLLPVLVTVILFPESTSASSTSATSSQQSHSATSSSTTTSPRPFSSALSSSNPATSSQQSRSAMSPPTITTSPPPSSPALSSSTTTTSSQQSQSAMSSSTSITSPQPQQSSSALSSSTTTAAVKVTATDSSDTSSSTPPVLTSTALNNSKSEGSITSTTTTSKLSVSTEASSSSTTSTDLKSTSPTTDTGTTMAPTKTFSRSTTPFSQWSSSSLQSVQFTSTPVASTSWSTQSALPTLSTGSSKTDQSTTETKGGKIEEVSGDSVVTIVVASGVAVASVVVAGVVLIVFCRRRNSHSKPRLEETNEHSGLGGTERSACPVTLVTDSKDVVGANCWEIDPAFFVATKVDEPDNVKSSQSQSEQISSHLRHTRTCDCNVDTTLRMASDAVTSCGSERNEHQASTTTEGHVAGQAPRNDRPKTEHQESITDHIKTISHGNNDSLCVRNDQIKADSQGQVKEVETKSTNDEQKSLTEKGELAVVDGQTMINGQANPDNQGAGQHRTVTSDLLETYGEANDDTECLRVKESSKPDAFRLRVGMVKVFP